MPNGSARGQKTYLDGDFSAPNGDVVFIEMDEDRPTTSFQKTINGPTISTSASNEIAGILSLPVTQKSYNRPLLSLIVLVDLGSYYG